MKIADNSAYTSLVEINSETDFAAKDSQFQDFAIEVADYLSNNQVNDINDLNANLIGKDNPYSIHWREYSAKKIKL